MGLVYADVEIINGEDLVLARHLIIGEEEIKRMHVNFWWIRVATTCLSTKPFRNNFVCQ